MSFNHTLLYRLLKQASPLPDMARTVADSYTGRLIGDQLNRITPVRHTLGISGDLLRLADHAGTSVTTGLVGGSGRMMGPAERAGNELGDALGDMFGKLNPHDNQYEERDIIDLINQQEAIALLDREAQRLERLARIQKRRKAKAEELTHRVMNSRYI